MKLQKLLHPLKKFMESEREALRGSSDIALVERLVHAACQEGALSRDIVSRCYYASASDASNEKPSTSELWVNIVWSRCQEIPLERFQAAKGKRLKIAEIAHAIFM